MDKNYTQRPIPMSMWGKDHWTTLLYIASRCTDYHGVPALEHMRTDPDRHPGLASPRVPYGDKRYPTMLAAGAQAHDHDDWDCADDIETAGFVRVLGTGVNPVFKMTEKGWEVVKQLQTHRAQGLPSATFSPKAA